MQRVSTHASRRDAAQDHARAHGVAFLTIDLKRLDGTQRTHIAYRARGSAPLGLFRAANLASD